MPTGKGCYLATAELGIRQGQLAKRVRLTQPVISMAVRRGAEFMGEHQYSLEG